MPEKRAIHVPGDKPRTVWLHLITTSGGVLWAAVVSLLRPTGPWYGTEEEALDAFADQIREEIALQRLDDYNDKREAETNA